MCATCRLCCRTLFADAAWRAQEAGFDGAELHYAHAYTMSSFLSRKNTREDGYGGPRENRVKLPLEVFRAVRARTNPDFAVGCRFLADECIDGGSDVSDAVYFGVEFAKAGMDFISTSRGGKFDDAKQPGVGGAAYPYTGPSGYECMPQYISDERGPFGRNVDATSAIRKAVHAEGLDTPIVCTGGVHNFEFAEKMLADEVCDVVGSARQTLADPDWFLKTRLGLGQSIRICEFTNYCEGLDQKHKTVTCQLWDKDDIKNPKVSKTSDGKRRLTPTGLDAAAMSAARTIEISEVGLRDGLQIERTMIPAEQKIALIDALSKTGLKKIEITGFAHPKVIPQLADAETVAAGIKREPGVRYAAFVPNARGAERAIKAGIDDLKAGVAVSDSFNRLNVRMTTEEGMKAIDDDRRRHEGHAKPPCRGDRDGLRLPL